MNVDILPAGTRQSATLNRTSLHITWAPIIHAGVQSNDYPGIEFIWKAYGAIFNTSPVKCKTVRHETDECVCNAGAILSDHQQAAGAADGEMGARDRASLLSLSFSACCPWVGDIIKIAEAISLPLSTVISNAPASGSVLRGLPLQSNNLSGGINCTRTKPLDSQFNWPF